ncbi:hypothetical protein HS088_TW06G00815 [Tripterygium wilfordii]|uniref:Uncharacterized protein n=1 Tax=Tripterygium wilfordii TaxID=458696 RepID=A0A7J7DK74_TRIWF|nr:hypothetical protein HS088_TW06G00815 [Tripterygium wilfordii]
MIFSLKHMEWREAQECIFIRYDTWIKALEHDFPSWGLQLLNNANSVKRWGNMKDKRPSLVWAPPLKGWVKWNKDGSTMGKPGKAGTGGVLCYEGGVFLCLFSCPAGVIESNEAEVLPYSRLSKLQCGLMVVKSGM